MYKAIIKLKREQLACLIQFAHDEGLDVCFHREEEISLQEHKQELPFEIVVGGVYKMRNGEIEEIVAKGEDQTYPFDGKSGRCYTKRGSRLSSKQSPYDLIKRIR